MHNVRTFDAKCDTNAKHNSTKCSYTLGCMYLFLRDMSVCISKGKKYMVLLGDELPKGFPRRLTFSGKKPLKCHCDQKSILLFLCISKAM